MQFFPQLYSDSQMNPTRVRGHESADRPMDDLPPTDQQGESYSAWRATSIFTLAPFSAPPGR